jgi:transposase
MISGLTLPANMFLSSRATDMRKSIDGLSGEVQEHLGYNSLDGSLFVFYNRRRDKIKLLFWDKDGYWVLYKRLEAGTFQMPAIQNNAKSIALDSEQLQLILSGIDLASVRHRKRYRIAS